MPASAAVACSSNTNAGAATRYPRSQRRAARSARPLDAFGVRSYIAGQVPNRPDTLARWIAEPAALVPGTSMPDMGVSDADARDMAAYLGSLR
jgi:cytochrome c1